MQDNPETISNGEGAAPENELVFSQDDVNRIIGERLGKERAKIAAELTSREEDLARREYQYAARETLVKRGYAGEDDSLEILSILNAKGIDELNIALDVLDKYLSYSKDRFDETVQDAINKRLHRGSVPLAGSHQPNDAVKKAMGL